MEANIERCCGLDVHRGSVVACVLVGAASQKPKKVVRTFGTMTRDLEALAAWLQAEGCTHVGMESTGIYWKPVYSVLEGRFELIVGNAQHIKNVPGRKTDVRDSEWICGSRPARTDPQELRSATPASRATRPASLPHQADPKPNIGTESPDQAARERQHQAFGRGYERLRAIGDVDAQSIGPRRNIFAADGRPGTGSSS